MAKGTIMLPLDAALLRKGERVCCAVSGGADSTAMLLAMVEANARKESLGIELSAAHVHHGLRGAEADADEAFVRELCQRLGVPLTLVHVDTPARMADEGEGLEEAARNLRYEALRGLPVDAIATAHHLDDQAETVLMKLLRGAWTEGLAGIAPEVQADGPRTIRPLLRVRKAEILEFLEARGQAWREDSTNRDLSLTRNRVRHDLLPVLRQFNPQIDALLAGMADVARDEEAYWQDQLPPLLRQMVLPGKPVRGGGRASSTAVGSASCALEIERLKALPAAMRRRVLRAAVRGLGHRLTAEETAKILALAGFGGYPGVLGKIGSRLELREGLRVERSARELQISRQG
ncbi:tRNA lysidine(34) synthetase TilS [Granulicella cerasi]|uniref:tRNA(Ile)-lysidine synthase n=1 Tax=Granulicella cerasi TaxID=741063 RepID=A0ABW1ZCJ4_9BACT|nr:tRNA lysidine(34) synthetase TilS [Granulicella cerasi]